MRAAEELHVTQGAVSHQVKALEAQLRLQLFHRRHQRLILTEPGRAYLSVVQEAFERLAAGTSRLLAGETSGAVTLGMSPNFAAKWMVHRLARFGELHPDIALRVSPSVHHVDFVRDGIDLAVRHGDGRWPELDAARLYEEEIFPVCSPALMKGARALRRPEDLRRAVLLRDAGPVGWPAWLAAAGVMEVDVKGPVVEQTSLAIDAAAAGQGVALARTALAAADLLSGRLARPFDVALKAPFAYYVVCPKELAARPKVARVRAWLLSEAAAEQELLAPLLRRSA